MGEAVPLVIEGIYYSWQYILSGTAASNADFAVSGVADGKLDTLRTDAINNRVSSTTPCLCKEYHIRDDAVTEGEETFTIQAVNFRLALETLSCPANENRLPSPVTATILASD